MRRGFRPSEARSLFCSSISSASVFSRGSSPRPSSSFLDLEDLDAFDEEEEEDCPLNFSACDFPDPDADDADAAPLLSSREGEERLGERERERDRDLLSALGSGESDGVLL